MYRQSLAISDGITHAEESPRSIAFIDRLVGRGADTSLQCKQGAKKEK